MSGNIYMRLAWVDEKGSWPSFRHLWRSTTCWIVLTTSIVWSICFRHYAAASARDPTSYFFDAKKGYQRSYSLEREEQAYKYIESINATDAAPSKPTDSPSMCIGVATIARASQEQYVRGTIGSLLEGLSDAQRADTHLTVFVAHTDPSVHPIYDEPWLKAASDKILTYNVSEDDMTNLRLFEEHHHPRNKSVYDYGYLLNDCLNMGTKWVAIFEDDVIARAGWYDIAISSLREVQDKVGNAQWLYLRMFYTEIFLGWNIERWPQYAGVSFVLIVVLLATLVMLRTRSQLFRRHLSNLDIGVLCCYCLPAFIILYFLAGFITMQPPRSGVRLMSNYGCCAQGFIFPKQIVPQVIERTRQAMNEDLYVDMLLERYADKEKFARFARFPSMLQHVGSSSSKGSGYDEDAAQIFNFQFETISP